MPESDRHPPPPLSLPAAALAAWLLPGLGHWMLGERKRGLVAGAAILGLFLAGMIVGGIDVVDRREDTLWYGGQTLVGPVAILAGEIHVYLDDHPPGPPGPRRTGQAEAGPDQLGYTRSIGRVNELGTLYCTLAGVLNLFALLDALGRAEHHETHEPHEPHAEA